MVIQCEATLYIILKLSVYCYLQTTCDLVCQSNYRVRKIQNEGKLYINLRNHLRTIPSSTIRAILGLQDQVCHRRNLGLRLPLTIAIDVHCLVAPYVVVTLMDNEYVYGPM